MKSRELSLGQRESLLERFVRPERYFARLLAFQADRDRESSCLKPEFRQLAESLELQSSTSFGGGSRRVGGGIQSCKPRVELDRRQVLEPITQAGEIEAAARPHSHRCGTAVSARRIQADGIALKGHLKELIEVELTVKQTLRYRSILASLDGRIGREDLTRVTYVSSDEVAKVVDREADKFVFRDNRPRLIVVRAVDAQGRLFPGCLLPDRQWLY